MLTRAAYTDGIGDLEPQTIKDAGLSARVFVTDKMLLCLDTHRKVSDTVHNLGILGLTGYLTIKCGGIGIAAYEIGAPIVTLASFGVIEIEDQNRALCAIAAAGITLVTSATFYALLGAIGAKVMGKKRKSRRAKHEEVSV